MIIQIAFKMNIKVLRLNLKTFKEQIDPWKAKYGANLQEI